MSTSDSEDDFVRYGTPLEELEEDEIPRKKPCLLEDQIATDKRGRRLFHGAFTGGFSAGFFNTVGTLEGWTPSSFKSSKSQKEKVVVQKPQDFMDEEDFSEFGIAPVILKAKQGYMNDKEVPYSKLHGLHFGKYVLKDLLRPARETVGMKLLKKMGWKPGQGVGPRVTSDEKKVAQKLRQNIYGCVPPPEPDEKEESKSTGDSEWENVKYAPSDYVTFTCEPKDNVCGIGYKGLDKKSVLGNATDLDAYKSKGKARCIKNFSEAFGVGALEEEDEDIFSRDDMSHYDFTLDGDVREEPTARISEDLEGILDGFVPQVKRVPKKRYQLPLLPKNYNPFKYINEIMCNRSTNFARKKPSRWDKDQVEDQIVGRDEIHSVLTESVEVTRKHDENEGKSEAQTQMATLTEKLISNVDIKISKFKPFLNNSEKQTRYEKYLKLKEIGKTDMFKNIQSETMSDREKEKEMVEFEKAAILFKPLNSMEDRFLSASQPDDTSNPLAEVEKFRDKNDERAQAAAMNMFGTLTRKIEEWTPCQLLCKRFNLPEPTASGIPYVKKKPEKCSLFENFASNQVQGRDDPSIAVEKITETASEPLPELADKTESPKTEVATTNVKTDLFKAIFLDESEDEEEKEKKSDSDSKKQPVERNEKKGISYEERLINSQRNNSLPSGIFENIDLESLTLRKESAVADKPEKQNESNDSGKEELVSTLAYGPKLPEKIAVRTAFPSADLTNEGGDWVEKKIRKKKKKEKKGKKSKHKHKHKSKK